MRNLVFWMLIFFLAIIHAIDMELTNYYVGNNWESESFPIMQLSIRLFGIKISLWLSRLIVYSYFFTCFNFRNNDNCIVQLLLITVLYYTSMIGWLFSLGLFEYPLPGLLIRY